MGSPLIFLNLKEELGRAAPLALPFRSWGLGVEILAEKIRKNETIKGITVSENEIKVSQYADDTTLILDGSKESLICALQVLENFSFFTTLARDKLRGECELY